MILITHDLGVVARICDSVAIIYAGEILEYGAKEDIFLRHAHPYTMGLFGAIPRLEKRVSRLNAIQGLPPDPTNLPEGCHFHPRCPAAGSECKKDAIPNVEISSGHICRCLHALERKPV
jgi:peptide/nickel transport system ATP-binding protein